MFEYEYGAVSPIYVAFSCNKNFCYFINEFIKTKQFNKEICLRANGSVRQSVNYSAFEEIKIPIPDKESLENFNNKYEKLQNYIFAIKIQNQKLLNLKELYLKKFFR